MSFHHPQTPQSPSQFSPSTTDPMTSMASSITSLTTTLPTPAHSVNGSSIPSEMAHDIGVAEDSPQKRKRPVDDLGEREQKKVHIEDRRLGIEDLHLDVGKKYLLCRTPHTASFPRISDDLFEMFDLTGLAAEVARVLPNGEKNAIRKTYKGHIKRLGVNGHFDSVKADARSTDGLLAMMNVPDEEWNIHFVKNQEIENGFSSETRAKLSKAMSMAKGTVPKGVWDSGVLGELGPGNAAKGEKQTPSAKATAPNTPIPSSGTVARPKPQQPQAQEAARPRRAGKKRSYGDSSFEGYGDGYPDDDLGLETGYSTGEGDAGGSGVKRRKKVLDGTALCGDLTLTDLQNPGSSQQYPQVRQAYGPGMVGA